MWLSYPNRSGYLIVVGFIFLQWLMIFSFFSLCLFGHFYIFFGRMSIQIFCLFLFVIYLIFPLFIFIISFCRRSSQSMDQTWVKIDSLLSRIPGNRLVIRCYPIPDNIISTEAHFVNQPLNLQKLVRYTLNVW